MIEHIHSEVCGVDESLLPSLPEGNKFVKVEADIKQHLKNLLRKKRNRSKALLDKALNTANSKRERQRARNGASAKNLKESRGTGTKRTYSRRHERREAARKQLALEKQVSKMKQK